MLFKCVCMVYVCMYVCMGWEEEEEEEEEEASWEKRVKWFGWEERERGDIIRYGRMEVVIEIGKNQFDFYWLCVRI